MSDVKVVKTEKEREPVKTTVKREVTVTEKVEATPREPKKEKDPVIIIKD